MLIIVNTTEMLSVDDRRRIADQVRRDLGSDVSVLVGVKGLDIRVTGNRFLERDKPGLWYDWENAESNDPNWGDIWGNQQIKLVDAVTGVAVLRVLFWHSGTGYVERAATTFDGRVVSEVPRIIETRKLLLRQPVKFREFT